MFNYPLLKGQSRGYFCHRFDKFIPKYLAHA